MATNQHPPAGLADANTTFEAAFEQFPKYDPVPGSHDVIAEVIPAETLETDMHWLMNHPTSREWLGEKHFEAFRHYNFKVALGTREATLRVKRKQLKYGDNLGLLLREIEAFVTGNVRTMYAKKAYEVVATNPVGYDEVRVFHTQHPHGPSGAAQQSNRTVSAFSRSALVSSLDVMAQRRNENGESCGIAPDVLLYSPTIQHLVLDAMDTVRAQGISNAGALDATSDVVGGVAVNNNLSVNMRAVRENRLPAGWAILLDTTKGARPFVIVEGERPHGVYKDSETDDNRFIHDEYWYSVESDIGADAGLWQTAHLIAADGSVPGDS